MADKWQRAMAKQKQRCAPFSDGSQTEDTSTVFQLKFQRQRRSIISKFGFSDVASYQVASCCQSQHAKEKKKNLSVHQLSGALLRNSSTFKSLYFQTVTKLLCVINTKKWTASPLCLRWVRIVPVFLVHSTPEGSLLCVAMTREESPLSSFAWVM